jgi:DNA-binding transcriptional regulator YhcF (GntR family)
MSALRCGKQLQGFFVSELSNSGRKDMARQRLREALLPKIRSAMAEGLGEEEIHTVIRNILKEIE